MKTASVTEAQRRFKSVIHWVEAGEEVEITRKSQVIARIVPAEKPKRKIVWPDFYARAKSIFKEPKGEPLSKTVIDNREDRF